jgi:hypothetical protein
MTTSDEGAECTSRQAPRTAQDRPREHRCCNGVSHRGEAVGKARRQRARRVAERERIAEQQHLSFRSGKIDELDAAKPFGVDRHFRIVEVGALERRALALVGSGNAIDHLNERIVVRKLRVRACEARDEVTDRRLVAAAERRIDAALRRAFGDQRRDLRAQARVVLEHAVFVGAQPFDEVHLVVDFEARRRERARLSTRESKRDLDGDEVTTAATVATMSA